MFGERLSVKAVSASTPAREETAEPRGDGQDEAAGLRVASRTCAAAAPSPHLGLRRGRRGGGVAVEGAVDGLRRRLEDALIERDVVVPGVRAVVVK